MMIKIICRTIANLFAMIVTMEFIPDTTEEYYKQFNKLPIDQLCFDYSSMIFNDLLSKLYLHEFKFDENSKANIKNMIDMITLSFGQLMDENTWMDPTTKKLAKEKLLAIHYNIGAPDIIFDDKGLEKQSTQVCCNQNNFKLIILNN